MIGVEVKEDKLQVMLTEAEIEFLKVGDWIKLADNSEYFHMPFWFKKTEDPIIFERLNFSDLPEYIKNYADINNLK
jgi:hypothetical protein